MVVRSAKRHLLATELDRRGYAVTVVCMQRFGPLLKEIPHSVRVVRQPWWAPMVDLPEGPAVLITGDTNTETGFATLWKAAGSATPGHRRWLVAPHVPPENNQPIYSRPLAAAMRRADGLIAFCTTTLGHADSAPQARRDDTSSPLTVSPLPASRPSGSGRPAIRHTW